MNYEGFVPDLKTGEDERERHDEHFAKLLSEALELDK